MHCFKKAVCVKIASSIMPGVKMLRQNFVSAFNKSPKDKRLKILNLFWIEKILNFARLFISVSYHKRRIFPLRFAPKTEPFPKILNWKFGSTADETTGFLPTAHYRRRTLVHTIALCTLVHTITCHKGKLIV